MRRCDCQRFDFGDEAVAAAGKSFDVAGGVDGIGERVAELVHCGVEAVVEVDKHVGGPELRAEIFAGDQLAGTREENGEDFEGLAGEFEARAMLPEFVSVQIDQERAEAETD